MSEHPLIAGLARVQNDLIRLRLTVSDLQREAGLLNLQDKSWFVCERCEGLALPSRMALAEHRYHHHDGPEPQHWLDAEAKAAE